MSLLTFAKKLHLQKIETVRLYKKPGIQFVLLGLADRWGFVRVGRAWRLVGAMASPPASGASPPSLVIDLKTGSNIRVRRCARLPALRVHVSRRVRD